MYCTVCIQLDFDPLVAIVYVAIMPPVFDVDKVLKQLLDVRTEKNKKVKLSDDDIKSLCFKSREIFLAQPNLLELESPIKVVGKINKHM